MDDFHPIHKKTRSFMSNLKIFNSDPPKDDPILIVSNKKINNKEDYCFELNKSSSEENLSNSKSQNLEPNENKNLTKNNQFITMPNISHISNSFSSNKITNINTSFTSQVSFIKTNKKSKNYIKLCEQIIKIFLPKQKFPINQTDLINIKKNNYNIKINELQEQLSQMQIINNEQKNYIEILKQTLDNKLIQFGHKKNLENLNIKNPIDYMTELTDKTIQNENIKKKLITQQIVIINMQNEFSNLNKQNKSLIEKLNNFKTLITDNSANGIENDIKRQNEKLITVVNQLNKKIILLNNNYKQLLSEYNNLKSENKIYETNKIKNNEYVSKITQQIKKYLNEIINTKAKNSDNNFGIIKFQNFLDKINNDSLNNNNFLISQDINYSFNEQLRKINDYINFISKEIQTYNNNSRPNKNLILNYSKSKENIRNKIINLSISTDANKNISSYKNSYSSKDILNSNNKNEVLPKNKNLNIKEKILASNNKIPKISHIYKIQNKFKEAVNLNEESVNIKNNSKTKNNKIRKNVSNKIKKISKEYNYDINELTYELMKPSFLKSDVSFSMRNDSIILTNNNLK